MNQLVIDLFSLLETRESFQIAAQIQLNQALDALARARAVLLSSNDALRLLVPRKATLAVEDDGSLNKIHPSTLPASISSSVHQTQQLWTNLVQSLLSLSRVERDVLAHFSKVEATKTSHN